MRQKVIIGIDPGAKTGFAVRNLSTGEWLDVSTIQPMQIPVKVLEYGEQYEIFVVFEDARQRKWFGPNMSKLYAKFKAGKLSEKEQNQFTSKIRMSGGVKARCSDIENFLKEYQIPYLAQHPKKGATKISAMYLKNIYNGRTSEHSRDAIMLIQGYNSRNLRLYFNAA